MDANQDRSVQAAFDGYVSLSDIMWRPIKTAPRHTDPILIAGNYPNGHAYVEESWRHPDGHFNGRKLEPPTHWMPMPPAPTAGQE